MSPPLNPSSVDFVVNTFERTYRKILCPGYIVRMAQEHCYPFSQRVVLINNVADRDDATARAELLKKNGEIDNYFFVADFLEEALRKSQLSTADLQPLPHYSDCALVAIFLSGSYFLVYCDADVHMKESCDWISPSIELMTRDSRIAVANPNWMLDTAKQEAREFEDEYAIGYGFSDQLFLIRRSEFARPIYTHHALISLRYPLAAVGRVFEQRVDSYMRKNQRMRGTLMTATYTHEAVEGATYPQLRGLSRLRQIRNAGVLLVIRKLRLHHPLFRV